MTLASFAAACYDRPSEVAGIDRPPGDASGEVSAHAWQFSARRRVSRERSVASVPIDDSPDTHAAAGTSCPDGPDVPDAVGTKQPFDRG